MYLLKARRMVKPGVRKKKKKESGDSFCDLIVLRKKSTLQINTIIRQKSCTPETGGTYQS